MDINITTQQHKSIDLRSLVVSLMQGRPISNVHHHEVFDFDKEPDFDSVVIDDFSDRLETMELHREIFDDINSKINDYQKEKSKVTKQNDKSKVTKSSDKADTPPPASEASHQSTEVPKNLPS